MSWPVVGSILILGFLGNSALIDRIHLSIPCKSSCHKSVSFPFVAELLDEEMLFFVLDADDDADAEEDGGGVCNAVVFVMGAVGIDADVVMATAGGSVVGTDGTAAGTVCCG